MQKSNWETEAECDSQIQENGLKSQILSTHDTQIKDVWASNFHEEMCKLSKLAEHYNVIAMDTEFPGIIASRSEQEQRYFSEQQCEYMLVKRNVEETKMIQIGLSIADQHGNIPQPTSTWQFNFKFDKDKDRIVDQSYDLLIRAGVRFDKLISDGIDYSLFAEFFAGSSLILNKKMKWVVFHGSSDFAYLLRLVLGEELPQTIDDFYKTMKIYFPNIYDLKYIIKDIPGLKDVGLAKLSYEIGCSRVGPQHQAGSDSLLTLACYFKMLEKSDLFGQAQFSTCLNIIFGIGLGFIKTNANGFSNPRDYQENNSYLARDFDYREYHTPTHEYYDSRNHHYMSQIHPYMNQMSQQMTQMNGSYHQGPLYQYLHHQQQPALYHSYMYPPHEQQGSHSQQKRYL